MGIRLKASFNASGLNALEEFLDTQAAVITDIAQDVFATYEPVLREKLTYTPPARDYPADYPLRWRSPKQMRWWFASNGDGNGIPYVRTGGIAEAWIITFETTANSFKILINNPADGARFVYGSLAKDPDAAARFQQPFHADLGWPLAGEIANFYIEAMLTDFKAQYLARVNNVAGSSAQRAVTPRLPKR